MNTETFRNYIGKSLVVELEQIWRQMMMRPSVKVNELTTSQFKGIHYFAVPFILGDVEFLENRLPKMIETTISKLPKMKSRMGQNFVRDKLKKSLYNIIELSLGASLSEPEILKNVVEYFVKKTPKFTNTIFKSFIEDVKKSLDEYRTYREKMEAGVGFQFTNFEEKMLEKMEPVIANLADMTKKEMEFDDKMVEINKKIKVKSKEEYTKREKITSAYIRLAPIELNRSLFSAKYDEDLIDDSISVFSEVSLNTENGTEKKSEKVKEILDHFETLYTDLFKSDEKSGISGSARMSFLILKVALKEYFNILAELELILDTAYYRKGKEVNTEDLENEVLNNQNYTLLNVFFNVRTISQESRSQLLDNLIVMGNIGVLFQKDKFGNCYYVHLLDKIFTNTGAVGKIIEFMQKEGRGEELGRMLALVDIENINPQLRNMIEEASKRSIEVVKSLLHGLNQNFNPEKDNSFIFSLLEIAQTEDLKFVFGYCMNLTSHFAKVRSSLCHLLNHSLKDLIKSETPETRNLMKVIDFLKGNYNKGDGIQLELEAWSLKARIANLQCFQRKVLTHNWSERFELEADLYQVLVTKLRLHLVENFYQNLNFEEILVVIFKDEDIVNHITGGYFQDVEDEVVSRRHKVLCTVLHGINVFVGGNSYEETKRLLENDYKEVLEGFGIEHSFKMPSKKTKEEMEQDHSKMQLDLTKKDGVIWNGGVVVIKDWKKKAEERLEKTKRFSDNLKEMIESQQKVIKNAKKLELDYFDLTKGLENTKELESLTDYEQNHANFGDCYRVNSNILGDMKTLLKRAHRDISRYNHLKWSYGKIKSE